MNNATTPWGSAYGIARSVLAVSTALTLAGNPVDLLFRAAGHMYELPPTAFRVERWTLFWLMKDHLELARWIAVLLLAVVAAGYRPRVTGLLHWWVTLSFISASSIPDGGDQVATVLTLLLVPVTLTDPRQWHWARPPQVATRFAATVGQRVAQSAFFVIRLQVCAIYLNACMAKVRVQEWVNGTAIYYWMNDPLMGAGREHLSEISELFSSPYVVCSVTWSVLLMQVLLAMGLVAPSRLRPLLLPIGIGFHVGTVLAFGLASFCLAMMAALILYLFSPEAHLWQAARTALFTLRDSLRARYGEAPPVSAQHSGPLMPAEARSS